jgi:alkylation response protein AidB-like acyl-CoA dehydrogenase
MAVIERNSHSNTGVADQSNLEVGELVERARQLRRELSASSAAVDAGGADTTENMRRIWEEGLCRLNVPRAYGGVSEGQMVSEWPQLIEALTQLCAGEGSTGMNFVVHSLVTREIFRGGQIPDGDRLAPETLTFMASAIIDRGVRLVASNAETGTAGKVIARRVDGGIVVNGTKSFNTDSGGGGYANVGCALEGVEKGTHHALIPLDNPGVTLHQNWDNMGQRGTISQHITYQDVFVRDGWHYHVAGFEPALIPGVFLMHSCINLGIGFGAYDAALDFIRTNNRTLTPGLKDPAQDPLVTRHLGVWSTNLSAAHALQHSVAQRVATFEGTRADVVPLMVDAFKAKIAAINASLEVAEGLFDITGERSTSNTVGLDRFWRNARTFATHDPTDHKLIWVGAYDLADLEPPLMAILRV